MTALMRCLLFGLLTVGAAGEHAAAQPYPSRPVTFVVPFAPGGGTEFLARMLGQRLEQRFGKPFVIDNRPGGGGVTGAVAGARAAPDGHTILMAPAPVMAINVTLHKKLAYDPAVDFVPLALVVVSPYVLVVNPSLPVQSVAELAGPGQHVLGELFKTMTGTEIAQVPYRGTLAALNDIVAGHVQGMFCDIPPTIGLITEGKLRALGVTTTRRLPALPEVPPLSDAGPGYDAQSWLMIVVPAGTPTDVVERLHAEFKSIMAQPDVTEPVAKLGILPIDTPSVAELQRFVKSEIVRWGKLVQQAGIAGSQ